MPIRRDRGTRFHASERMSRHIACLSFDFDAMSGHVADGMVSPTPVSQGEFGNVGAGRILDLLQAKDIKTSWFIPGVVVETYPETVERVHAEGHEVGHHGWTHTPPAGLSRADEKKELERGNDVIERVTGRRARGYRSPSWDLSEHTIELLLAEGFVYDSSMMGHDHSPYFARTGDSMRDDGVFQFGTPSRLVEMPISWSLDDFPHFEFLRAGGEIYPGLQNASGVLENWLGDFEYMTGHTEWGVLTYTCHPYIIGRGHRMLMLERLIDRMAAMGAAFMTVEQAVEEFKRR